MFSVKKLVVVLMACLMLLSLLQSVAAEDKQWVVGFANIDEAVELQIAVRESMVAAAEKAGIKLILANNEFDGAKAVRNADDMITMKVDAFIEFNVDESVGPVIMEKMNAAGIPVFAVDIPHPGAAFFGANNIMAGEIAGEYLANASLKKWGSEPDCLLLVEDSTSGESVLNRVAQQPVGLRKIFPDYPEEKVFYIDSGTDAAVCQKMVSDFLSAHPDFGSIAIGAFNDVIALATLAAVETAGREADCILVAENEYAYLDYVKNNPGPVENEVFVGGVAFFFEKYGDFLMPSVVAVLNGGEMPENVYVEHQVVDRSNAYELFPNYFK